MSRFMLIALGGALGTALRYLTNVGTAQWLGTEIPYGTLVVNLVGSFAIGLVQEIGLHALAIDEDTRLFLTTGVMGGLTTYSSFSYETIHLLEIGAWHRAWINVAVTTAACLGLCFLGITLGRSLLATRG